jgi:type IV pilus biogenesis protein CpaD/CtpE
MAFLRSALAIALFAATAACSSTEGQETTAAAASADPNAPINISLRLGPDVWNDFQAYLKGIDQTKHGAFAIANDGSSASAAATCDAATCADTQQVQAEAVSNCESKGAPCMLFAVDRVTQVPYRMPE